MAYMNQAKKQVIAAALKVVMPKDWKYSLKCDKHGITLTIRSAPVDLIAEVERVTNKTAGVDGIVGVRSTPATHVSVNEYWLSNQFDESLPIFQNIKDALNTGNHDRSDPQTDYFDVGHYAHIRIGAWDKPFQFTKEEQHA